MTDTMVERIAEQLDRHCRVVAVVPAAAPQQQTRPEDAAATVH